MPARNRWGAANTALPRSQVNCGWARIDPLTSSPNSLVLLPLGVELPVVDEAVLSAVVEVVDEEEAVAEFPPGRLLHGEDKGRLLRGREWIQQLAVLQVELGAGGGRGRDGQQYGGHPRSAWFFHSVLAVPGLVFPVLKRWFDAVFARYGRWQFPLRHRFRSAGVDR